MHSELPAMTDQERLRALRGVRDLEPGDHLCCIYRTEEEHRAVLTDFLRHGLEHGDKVLYIADAHTAETILGYLEAEGLALWNQNMIG